MSNSLVAAIDIGSMHNSVALMDKAKGHVLQEHKKLSNNLTGVNNLWQEATRLMKKYELQGVDFVLESSWPYWFGPYWWLKDKCSTLNHCSITALNSQIVSGFKGKFSHKKQKSDSKDAKTIGNRFRFGQFDPVYVAEGGLLTLKYYTRYRLHGLHNLVVAKTFFLAYLFIKMSEYGKYCKNKRDKRFFKDILGATSTEIITRYSTAEELSKANVDELSTLLSKASRGKITDINKKIEIAMTIGKDSYPLPQEGIEPVNFILKETLNRIRFLEGQVKEADKRIEPILDRVTDPIKTMKGIGKVFAAGIIAEWRFQ